MATSGSDALQSVLERADAPPELFDLLLNVKLKTLGTISFLGESGAEVATKIQRIADANGHGALPKGSMAALELAWELSRDPLSQYRQSERLSLGLIKPSSASLASSSADLYFPSESNSSEERERREGRDRLLSAKQSAISSSLKQSAG